MTQRELVNKMAKDMFGMSVEEAQEMGLCIHCKELALPKCYSEAGRREFHISGLCEMCFDGMFEGNI